MIVCLYDGSIDSYFTAVFSLYSENIIPDIITSDKHIQCGLDTKLLDYGVDEKKSGRIKRCILKNMGKDGYRSVLYVLASCNDNKGKVLYDFLNVMFKHKKDAPFMISNKAVHDFLDISRAVALEVHRMQGFIHFKECENDVYYAEYSPDNDITQFIMPHFCSRFNSMRFLIHDVDRNIIGIFDGKHYKVFHNEGKLTVYLSQNEEKFLHIWKSYYQAVNIEERKNKKLQNGFMPLRYRKHMSETHNDIQ